jgi:multimeric flavodoxin WrbA
MGDHMRITAIVGSYRKGGIIDTAVDEILISAREEGAEVTKIYLIDKQIEFCTNCRTCMQQDGPKRGECPIVDDMGSLLDEIERSDAVVLASPMNFGTVTAVMKVFIERLACLAYWPWGANAPKMRNRLKQKRAVLVASSAAPAFIARLTSPLVKLLKYAATVLGARTIGVLFIGLAAREQKQEIGARAREKARLLGKKLAANGGMRAARH